jgi:hypothetical protein
MLGLKIYQQQKNRPKEFSLDSSKGQTEFDFVIESGWHDLQVAEWHKLSRAGLIKEIVGGRYIITPTFQSLINFIRFRANDPLFSISIQDSL